MKQGGGQFPPQICFGRKRKLYDKFAELLTTLWIGVKIESPSYRNIERAFLASNSDPTGVLLNAHLTRYWDFISPSSNRQTFYVTQRFFTFVKTREEPPIGRGGWAVLVYFENQRTDLLSQYDERISNQKKARSKKRKQVDLESHFTNFATSIRKFLRVAG